MRHETALLAAALVCAVPARAQGQGRVVLIPFENVSRVVGAPPVVARAVDAALTSRGWEVVRGDVVEEALHAERVRYLESLPTAVVGRIAEKLEADAVIVGSVLAFGGPKGVALAARLVTPAGTTQWAAHAALTPGETVGAFGRGGSRSLEDLLPRAVERLLRDAPFPGDRQRKVGAGRPSRGAADGFRTRDLVDAPRRVAVLPLAGVSEDRSAPRVVDALLRNRLAQRETIAVVEPADVRAAMVRERVGWLSSAPPAALQRIGSAIGTTLFLSGAVHVGLQDAGMQVEIYLTIVDIAAGRVLWSSLHSRSAADFTPVLGMGGVHSAIDVADRVVAEMVDSLYQEHTSRPAVRRPPEEKEAPR